MSKKDEGTYRELCDLIGDRLAEKLSLELAGQRFYFSQKKGITASHDDLVRSIGMEAAEKLAWSWYDLTLLVPSRGRLEARDRMILKLISCGYSVRAVARLVNLGERAVQKVIKQSQGN